MKKSSDF